MADIQENKQPEKELPEVFKQVVMPEFGFNKTLEESGISFHKFEQTFYDKETDDKRLPWQKVRDKALFSLKHEIEFYSLKDDEDEASSNYKSKQMKQDEYRRKKIEAGKKGMEKRWGKHKKGDNAVTNLLITKNNSSSPSSSSIAYSSNKEIYTSFNKFWEVYPHKVGKKPAKKAWGKIKPDDGLVENILSAVKKQKQKKQWQHKQFIPYPSTWLNQERWKDEVEDVSSFRETLDSI